MPWRIGRGRVSRAAETELVGRAHAVLHGDLPCAASGCAEHTGVVCAYVDHRGRACDTAWCAEHHVVLDGAAYCRRHAGTIVALGGTATPFALPDVGNRTPALVNWVSFGIDGDVRELLEQLPGRGSWEQLLSEAVHPVTLPGGRVERWERTWKVVDHTGPVIRVSLGADDECSEIAVRVNGRVVHRATPPWIGGAGGGDDDGAVRERFSRELVEAVAGAAPGNAHHWGGF